MITTPSSALTPYPIGYIVGHVESGHVVWMRSAIVAVALGVTVAAVAAACWLPSSTVMWLTQTTR